MIKNISGPSLSYTHDDKLALEVVFFVQNLHHYILMRKSKEVLNSNPMSFIFIRWVINGKYACWIIILQEFNSEFVTPKRKKSLPLIEFIFYLPVGASDPPLIDDLLDEHMFSISIDDSWYGDNLVCLQKYMFGPHFSYDD
jgi:hypothetical protein